MDSTQPHRYPTGDKNKLLVLLGATGTGKSRLSIDLATRFYGEVINSDKMQVYKGLDITTNKMPMHERSGIPHHLLGEIDSEKGEFTPADFRSIGDLTICDIVSRQRFPILAGGSNSFVHALVAERFNPDSNVFHGSGSVSSELRYNCCFIWVDVSLPVLFDYLSVRVDDMLDLGMFEELAEFYDHEKYPGEPTNRTGLMKAIGVPEFESYFRRFPPKQGTKTEKRSKKENDKRKSEAGGEREGYEEAVREIKDNTCQLAKKQIGKILRLRGGGWVMRKVDATASFRAAMAATGSREGWREIWEREVLEPSVKIVRRFLEE